MQKIQFCSKICVNISYNAYRSYIECDNSSYIECDNSLKYIPLNVARRLAPSSKSSYSNLTSNDTLLLFYRAVND